MSGNLGASSLPRRRRASDPMTAFDSLPPQLRRWLSEAALPWSPASTRRIWAKCLAKGQTPEEALVTLGQAELRTLTRDKWSAGV